MAGAGTAGAGTATVGASLGGDGVLLLKKAEGIGLAVLGVGPGSGRSLVGGGEGLAGGSKAKLEPPPEMSESQSESRLLLSYLMAAVGALEEVGGATEDVGGATCRWSEVLVDSWKHCGLGAFPFEEEGS